MARADYLETVEEHGDLKFICINDMNVGGMSVTNDIENVVKEIERRHRIDANNYIVIYCDSEQTWDGWNNEKQDFFHLDSPTKEQAIQKCLYNFTKT